MSVKEYLKNRFVSGKTAGFYLSVAAALIMLISDIAYIASDFGDRTFSFITFAFVLAGVALEFAVVFADLRFGDVMSLLSCICYGTALGMHIYLGLPTLSDIWNGVNFVGGNADAVIAFSVTFGIGTVAAVAANFMKRSKQLSA